MTEKKEKSKGLAVVDGGAAKGEADGEAVEEHADVRRKVLALREKADENYWELGSTLEEVYKNDMYRSWGFDSWKEYVEQEVDINIRKAQYLVKLQEWFGTMTPAIQKWMRELGWTKARMLMHVVTQENASEWKNRCEGKTVAEIEAMLKSENDDGDGDDGGSDTTVEKSKTLSIKGMFPDIMDVWEKASAHAADIGETEKACQMLNLICIDYLASNTNIMTKEDHLKKMEKQLGLKLVAIREEDDAVVYGGEYLDSQEEAPEDAE